MWPLATVIALSFWLAACVNLRVEWSLNEQYAYGWAVPFLCAFLFWKRGRSPGETGARLTGQPAMTTGSTGDAPVPLGVSPSDVPASSVANSQLTFFAAF